MLNELSNDRINRIAHLARQTREAQFDLTDRTMISRAATRRAGKGGTGGEPVPGSEIDEALENPEILEGTVGSERLHALKQDLDALTPAGRRELLAVMFVGRGDFAANEWDRAVAQAERIPEASLTRSATDEMQLHDYLQKGLYELGQA